MVTKRIPETAIIPHTSDQTTLTSKQDGAPVNLEADLIGKYVEKLVSPHVTGGGKSDGVSLGTLKEHGYA